MTTSEKGLTDEPRVISKGAFEGLVIATGIALMIPEVIVFVAVRHALGLRSGEGGWIGGVGFANLIAARLLMDGVLKRLGMSRSGKTLEVRGRTVVAAEGDVDDDVVEVWCPSSMLTGLGVACLAVCLLLTLIMFAIPPDRMQGVGYGYLLIACSGLAAGYFFYERWWGRPQAWADSSGITGYPVGPHVRRRFVSWSEVATCEMETHHDTFGKPVLVRPILKGWRGEALMTLNLLQTRPEDQARLVKYIKARLPKPKDDNWLE